MNMDDRRKLIAALEPLMRTVGDDLDELHAEAVKLCKQVERHTENWDNGSTNGLLLAALVNHLKYELRGDEQDLTGTRPRRSFFHWETTE